VKDGKIAIVRA